MKRFGPPLLAAAAALLLLVANTLPASNPAPSTVRLHDARLSQLLRKPVEDPNAQQLGTLKDFALDVPSARLEYALVSSGGMLGLGRHTRALPVSALSGATILRGVLGTSITKAQWGSYPPFAGNVAALPAPSSSRSAQLTPTGRASVANRPAGTPATNQGRLRLASDLLGSTIVNRQDQNLGTISDLFVDLDQQKPVLAIIRTRKLLRRPETFAVPLSLLSRKADNQLLLDASPQNLEQAPLFTDQAWSTAARQGVHTIYRVPSPAET